MIAPARADGAYGPGLTAVILTSANEDGARGLEAVVAAGGIALSRVSAASPDQGRLPI